METVNEILSKLETADNTTKNILERYFLKKKLNFSKEIYWKMNW